MIRVKTNSKKQELVQLRPAGGGGGLERQGDPVQESVVRSVKLNFSWTVMFLIYCI